MHQHVWLPSLRVWAPITERTSSSSSSSCSSSLSQDICGRSYAKEEDPSFALETEDPVKNKEKEKEKKKKKKKRRERKEEEEGDDCDGEKKKRRRKPDHMCPICLCSVEESNLSVLQWCMHSFCVECIEKWSKQERFCPLCKQTFHGWYYNIRRSGEFDVKKLAKCMSSSSSSSSPLQLHASNQISSWQRIQRYPNSRFQGGSMSEAFLQRSYPLPRRRSFGVSRGSSHSQPRRDEENRISETLKWRASIYKRHLRAIPPQINTRVNVVSIDGPDRKTRIEKRLKPWIIRELHAITGDPEPSLLVQLVLSLWVNVVMHKENGRLRESEAVEQLKPFLDEKAADFWHEMKCFAESPFSLMAYDSVVKYKRCSE